jgi:hypothetical protein
MLKKLFNSFSAVAILATSFVGTLPTYAAVSGTDVIDNWAGTNGYTVYPTYNEFVVNGGNNPANRAAIAKWIVKYAEDVDMAEMQDGVSCNFPDLGQIGAQDLRDSAVKACEYGLMKGYANGNFGGNDTLTRAQLALIMARLYEGTDFDAGVPFGQNAYEYWNAKEFQGEAVMSVSMLDSPITKYSALAFMYKAKNAETDTSLECTLCLLTGDCPASCTNGGGTGTGNTGVVVEVKAGMLNLSLGSKTPANNSSVPARGIANAAEFVLQAGAGNDITVRSLELERVGLGSRTDIDRIYFEKNGIRISSRASLTSDGKAVINFSPALVLKSNSTEMMDLVVSFSGAAGSEHGFKVINVDSSAQTMNATPSPLVTPTLRTTTYTVGSVSVTARGSTTTHRAGDSTDLELGQFRVENTSADDKDLILKGILLRNEGNGEINNLTNLALYRDSTKVSSDVKIDGKEVSFALNDTLGDGTSATYYVRGDVKYVDNTSGDTFTFKLRNTEDFNIVESSTMFRATVTGTPMTLSSYTIEGSDVTLVRDSNFTLSQTVNPGAVDVYLVKGTITAKEAIQLEDLVVSGTTTIVGPSSMFSKLTLKIGNTTATFTPTSSMSTSFNATFDGTFNVNGTVPFEIKGDVRSTSTGGTIRLSDISVTNFSVREYVDSQNTISSAVGTLPGALITVSPTKLNVTRTDGLTARTVIRGAQDVTLLGATFSTTESTNINITQLTLTGDNSNFNDKVTATLYVNGTSVRTATYRNNQLLFSSLNIPVKNGTPAVITIKGTIDQSTTAGQTLNLQISSVNATDSNSQTVTPSPATLAAAALTVQAAGSASLTQNSSTPNPQLLPGGATDVELGRFNVNAQNDDITLTDLYLANTGTLAVSNRLNNVKLYDSANMTAALGIATLRDGGIAFENLEGQNYKITAGNSKTLVVKADINTLLNTGEAIAPTAQLYLSGNFTGAEAGTVGGVRFLSSNGEVVSSVAGSTGLVISKAHRIVRGAIQLTYVDPSNTSKNNLMAVKVKAIGNRVTLTGVTVSVTNDTDNAVTYGVSNSSYGGTPTLVTAAGTNGSTVLNFGANSPEIQAGQEYTIYISMTGYDATGTAGGFFDGEFRVSDASYLDMFQDGNLFVNSVANYAGTSTYQVGALPFSKVLDN